ncbi:hypothetical protein RRG08_019465 [Elysia crispata]|uniref:Uncharacterized protein n=1 Tax=Elysia crispata TaxID=231223 RepID=A0AAE1A5N4_9GAST|nr:hypothetical protein RRG08_019465 [Elysia crispata]
MVLLRGLCPPHHDYCPAGRPRIRMSKAGRLVYNYHGSLREITLLAPDAIFIAAVCVARYICSEMMDRPGVQVFPGTLGTSRRGASGRLCLTYGTQKMSFIDISISRHPAIYRRGERDARHSPIKALELLTLSLSE